MLLSFLRFVKDSYFDELCKTPSLIVERYFSSMLEREIDRQELRMSSDEQNTLLRLIAKDMYDKDYTSDSKENMISLIKEKAGDILANVRLYYPAVDRPSIDKLATTLSNHAFFDRSNQGENSIKFINEFVFGNYIASNILLTQKEWIASDERFVEPAVNSYRARDSDSKNNLWNKIQPMSEFLDKSTRMKFESLLKYSINDQIYDHSDILSLSLDSINLFEMGEINHGVFTNCTFQNSRFFLCNFHDVTFFNCSFWDCEYNKEIEADVSFLNCRDNNDFIQKIENYTVELSEDSEDNIEYYILEKIWGIGSAYAKSLHYFTANLFQNNEFSKKEVVREIKKLKEKGLLLDAHDSNFIKINKTKFNEIKTILGRK